jgi:hypothetical protein
LHSALIHISHTSRLADVKLDQWLLNLEILVAYPSNTESTVADASIFQQFLQTSSVLLVVLLLIFISLCVHTALMPVEYTVDIFVG